MSDLLDEMKAAIVDGLQNRTLTSCSRWAARRRVMSGDFAGPYSDKYHPWVREMHDSWAPFNYAMKGAQLGVTEVAINRAFYTLDILKRNVLYVLPTSLIAGDFSKARFGGALSLSPYLKQLFTDTNAVNIKQAGNCTLYIRGSRGESNLVSIDVSELILDEVDRMDQDKIDLALTRLDGQLSKHVWGISTPTLPKFGIHKYYMGSTQEHFMFRCPSCSRLTELIWPDCMEIVGEHATDIRCQESYLKCKECNAKLHHEDKPNFLKNAIWESFAPNSNPEVRGFYINQLYSFTKQPGALVQEYFKGHGDELAAKEFHNSKLGLPFVGDKAGVTDEMLEKALEGSTHTKADLRPDRAGRVITMGIDRGLWNYVEVCEWFFDKYSST
jgi:phage terminase large subunit GpA-like protein